MSYVDPKGLECKKSSPYRLNKKSDVYSIGVLLWELSSGKKPFVDTKYDEFLAMKIVKGLRKSVIDGIPEKYSDLYKGKRIFFLQCKFYKC